MGSEIGKLATVGAGDESAVSIVAKEFQQPHLIAHMLRGDLERTFARWVPLVAYSRRGGYCNEVIRRDDWNNVCWRRSHLTEMLMVYDLSIKPELVIKIPAGRTWH